MYLSLQFFCFHDAAALFAFQKHIRKLSYKPFCKPYMNRYRKLICSECAPFYLVRGHILTYLTFESLR